MNVSFIKQIKDLEREVLLKSVELDDDGDDFQFELDDFSTNEEIFPVLENVQLMQSNQLIFLEWLR